MVVIGAVMTMLSGSLVYYHCAYRQSSVVSLFADVFIVLLCSLAILGLLFRHMSIAVPVDPLHWQISQDAATSFFACLANTLGAAESVLRVAATGHDKRLFFKPSDDDWKITKEICEKLEVFYTATKIFYGTRYPTANLYFPNICEIKLALIQWQVSGIKVIESMASKMIEKFDKYWSIVNGLMGVAVLLDPRFKTDLLKYYFGKIYGLGSENEIQKILVLCRDLYEQFERDSFKEVSEGFGSSEGSQSTNSASLSEFKFFKSQKKRKLMRSEFDHFLEEESLPDVPDFDVLSWWKLNVGKYPILSQMAKDILAIPVSAVASESAFSTSGRLIGPHCSRLHPKIIEALMCAQNWLSIQMKDDTSLENAHASVLYDSDVESEQSEEEEV